VKQIEIIHINRIAQVPPTAIWLRRQWKKVYSSLVHADRDNVSHADAKMIFTTVASMVQRLDVRLMPLLDNHHTSSLTYRPCFKCLNHGKKPCTARLSILDDTKPLQLCGNASRSWLTVAIRTSPHPEKLCIMSWWQMLSPPCGPNATSHVNYLLVAFKRYHRNCYCILLNVFYIVETTEILEVIDVGCVVGKSSETPSNVILELPFWHCTPLGQFINGLDFG